MNSVLLYYLIAINIVTFFVYGIDKWKAKQGSWRISEATLLLLAVIGGSIGALSGMQIWHHKTMHKGGTCDVDNIVGGYQFKYGLPLILLAQIALIALTSCRTKQTVGLSVPINVKDKYVPEHSPNVFLTIQSHLQE